MWRVRKGKIGPEVSPWPTSVGIQPPGLVYSSYPAEIHGLVNQVADGKEANAVFSRLSACTQKFLSYTPRPIGFVEKDERILQAGRRRVPYILEDPTQVAARQIIGAADVFSSRRKRSIDR